MYQVPIKCLGNRDWVWECKIESRDKDKVKPESGSLELTLSCGGNWKVRLKVRLALESTPLKGGSKGTRWRTFLSTVINSDSGGSKSNTALIKKKSW